MDFRDYYTVLGIPRDADEKQIKKAYRELARKYHPDVYSGPDADEKFKAINEAHQVLSDPEKRARYDRFGADWERYQTTAAPEEGADFAQWFGGRTAQPGGRRVRFEQSPGGDGDFSDFFDLLFGGSGRFSRPEPAAQRGDDQEHPIELSLREAFGGTTRTFELQSTRECDWCRGTGVRNGRVCENCEGAGVVSDRGKIEVTIPPGVREGSRIRVAGKGSPGRHGGPAGDIYLKVSLANDDRFELDGNDVRVNVDVPLYTALLGGEVIVPTLTGKVALTVPAGTQNGQVIRLRGLGWPVSVRGQQRGDLKARVSVVLPTQLDDEERALFQQLAELRSGAKVAA
jgi:DnaJ-class molecular chaperone